MVCFDCSGLCVLYPTLCLSTRKHRPLVGIAMTSFKVNWLRIGLWLLSMTVPIVDIAVDAFLLGASPAVTLPLMIAARGKARMVMLWIHLFLFQGAGPILLSTTQTHTNPDPVLTPSSRFSPPMPILRATSCGSFTALPIVTPSC